MQISRMLINAVEKFPERVAVECEKEKITFRELYQQAMWHAAKFLEMGLCPRDRVVLYAENGPEFLVGFFALQLIGAIPATAYRMWTSHELKTACAKIDTKFILTESKSKKTLQSELAGYRILGIELVENPDRYCQPFECEDDEPALIRFTSGTIGIPKAVLLSHRNVTSRLIGSRWERAESCLSLVAFPFPILRILLALGCGVTIMAMKKFSTRTMLSLLEQSTHRIDWVWATPGIVAILSNEIDDPGVFSRVGGIYSVGARLLPNVQLAFQNKFGCPIFQSYGLTETPPLASSPEGIPPRVGSVGKPLTGVEIRIDHLDATGIGKILCKTSNDLIGYLDGNTIKKFPVSADGWQITGDLGWMDKDGFLFVIGREAKLLNIGGLKVSPGEIADVLYGHPSVKLAKIVSKANLLLGEVPVAYVVPKEKGMLSQQELKFFCATRLAKYKIPRWFHIVDEIALSASGKLD